MRTKVRISCKKNKPIDYDGAYREEFAERISAKDAFPGAYKLDDDGNILLSRKQSEAGDDYNIKCLPENTRSIAFYINEEHAYAEVVSTLQDSLFSFVIMLNKRLDHDATDNVLDFFATLQVHAKKTGTTLRELIDANPIGICPDDTNDMEELHQQHEMDESLDDVADITDDEVITPAADETACDFDMLSRADTSEDATETLRKLVEHSSQRISELTSSDNSSDDELAKVMRDEAQKTRAGVSYVIREAISGLEGVKQGLIDTKQRHIEEVTRLCDSSPSEDVYDAAKIQALIDSTIQNFDSVESDAPTDTENEEECNLLAERERLSCLADDISAHFDDYDAILKRSRKEQDSLIKNIDNMNDPSDEIVNDLIALLNEQTLHNEQLNDMMKKERIRHKHHIKQLSDSKQKVAELSSALDEVKRRLRFSQANQRKAEEFVRSCRETTSKIIAEAQTRIDAAIRQAEEMRKKVELANRQAADEKARAESMIEQRDKAFIDRDTAIKNLNREKEHAAKLVNEFSTLIDEFTAETIERVKVQIARAERAERELASATKHIDDVSRELDDVRKMLFDAENKLSAHEEDILRMKDKLSDKTAECNKLKDMLAEERATHAELQARFDELAKRYDDSESNCADLSSELAQAQQGRDDAVADKLHALEEMRSQMNDEITQAYANRDASISSLVASRDEALAASEEFVDALARVADMPSSFGRRSEKVAAFDSAYNAFVTRKREAERLSEDVIPVMAGAHSANVVQTEDILNDVEKLFE